VSEPTASAGTGALTTPVLAEVVPAPPRRSRWRRLFNSVFLVTVLLPTLLAGGYYGLVASDVYVSESRFVVRSPQRQAQTGLGAILAGTGLTRAQDDAYSVHDYIRSRDALRELEAKLGLGRLYSADRIDLLNRFPTPFDPDSSFEGLYRHYLRHVGVEHDTVSSISVLRVRAYTAQDALAINDQLLQLSERLVNNLNLRSRQDLIQVAEREVTQAEERAKIAALALAGFRSDRQVFDPERQGNLQLSVVNRLQEELMATESQLATLRRLSPTNPQVSLVADRVEALRAQIAQERARLTGAGASLAAKAPAYDRLVLERTFADRQLASALSSLEAARSEATRKQLYLERLVAPNLPDAAIEPRRARSVFTVFVMGLVAWGIVSFVIVSVREHAD
jgi:capsular polysaccharide transport system permease protein